MNKPRRAKLAVKSYAEETLSDTSFEEDTSVTINRTTREKSKPSEAVKTQPIDKI